MRHLRRACLAAFVLFVSACDARLPDPDTPGARLYAERCRGCHRLYAPGLLTATMWEVTVARMQGELARRGLPPLTAEETRILLAYLEQHSTGRGTP